MPWLIAGGLFSFMMVMLLLAVGLVLLLGGSGNKLPEGITVAGLSVGEMSEKRAADYLHENIPSKQITFTDAGRSWTLSLAQLGVNINTDITLQQAQDAAPNTAVAPYYSIDLNQAQMALVYLSDLANIPAVPGNPPQVGRALEIPVMLDRLRVNVSGELADDVMEMNMLESEPPETETVNTSFNGATTTHVVESGQELGLIARIYGVEMNDIVALNNLSDPNLIYEGQELTIPAAGVYSPSAADAPAAPTNTGKAIVVSTSTQRIYAYENGQLIRSHLTSTGLPATPTVLGDYNIYVKYRATDMRGPDYFLPQVPWTMYFYQGYGIHGTYWHNSFGRPMSHGCVNLPPEEAQWFFNWAEVGTLVRVI